MKSLTTPEWYDESGNLVKPKTKYIHTVRIYRSGRKDVDSAFVTIITSSSVNIINRETLIQCLGNDKGKIVAVSGISQVENTSYLYLGYSNDFGSSILNNSGLYRQAVGGITLITFSDLTNEKYTYEENGPVMQILGL